MMSATLRAFIMVALLMATFAYVVELCIQDGSSVGGDYYTCMYTPSGVSCPANYYCPVYPSYMLGSPTYQAILNSSSCSYASSNTAITNSLSYTVICPCTPGFYCPKDTEQPVYCPQGHYCPSDGSNVNNAMGLGTWGGTINVCPEGNFCPTGSVAPFECGSLSDCPEGMAKAKKGRYWAVVIIIIIIFAILFAISDYIKNKEKSLQNLRLEKEKEDAALALTAQQSNPLRDSDNMLNAPMMASSSLNDAEAGAVLTSSGESPSSFLIEFEGISLTLKIGTTVMSNVSGKFSPGRLCAIMGASGAGKTTVINLITGKVKKTSGKVFVNGTEVDGLIKYQKLVGFVPQEDVMIRELSVRDNIEFSANYRLPVSLTKAERERKVNHCINELGVSHIQHSAIGDERTRGVSGGQRKRVNIGIELVADPKVLFLDEPTSGLDSTTATSLCSTLKKIAKNRSMTVAAVIHQPSLSSFLEFDDLLLLGKGGRAIYHGPVKEAEVYFKSIGFPLPAQCNPADFYLDITQGVVPREGFPTFEWTDLFDLWQEHIDKRNCGVVKPHNKSETPEPASPSRISNSQQHYSLAAEFASVDNTRASASAREQQSVIAKVLTESKSPKYIGRMACSFLFDIFFGVEQFISETVEDLTAYVRTFYLKDPIRTTPSAWYQFYICLRRATIQCFGGFGPFILECILHLLCGAVIAVTAGRLQFVGPLPDVVCAIANIELQGTCASPLNGQYPQAGNFMCFGVLFAAVATAAPVFGNEQVNYWRESAAGLQSLPYFLGKWIAYIPRMICSAFFFWFAFSIKFNNTDKPRDLFLIILFLYWFGYSIGFFVSQLVPIRDAALTGVLFALIFAVGFSGVNPNMARIKDKPKAESGLWSLSGPRWAIEAFFVSSVENYNTVPDGQYEGQPYEDVSSSLSAIGYGIDNFPTDIKGLFWDGIFWGCFALLLMLVTYRNKKR